MSMDWYYEAIDDDDDDKKDFEGCPSCLGGDITFMIEVYNVHGQSARLFKCNDCGQKWEEINTSKYFED